MHKEVKKIVEAVERKSATIIKKEEPKAIIAEDTLREEVDIVLKKNHVGAGYLTVACKQLRKLRQFLRKS